ncbi:MAG: S8 family serine peptidase [Pyrinomonadaceae bacterium]
MSCPDKLSAPTRLGYKNINQIRSIWDLHPIGYSNLASSIGRRGLRAPGDNITSLGADGHPVTFGGTSAAAPFVTGAVALLCSLLPTPATAEVKLAVIQASAPRRASVVPPLLDAWGAYQFMKFNFGGDYGKRSRGRTEGKERNAALPPASSRLCQ